jgi:cobalt-zinc-cadmium efflux system protein
MAHNHNYHDHHHGTKNIALAFILNFSFSILEIVGGIFTNSTAILSDAVHDLGDSLALALSFFTDKVSHKKSNDKYTFGYKRLSVIGAIINILVLTAGTTYVLIEAISTLQNPEEVNSMGMLWLAGVGIIINGLAAFRMKDSKRILDRTVVLHLLEDLMGWAAVLVVSVVIHFTGWYILDPILSIFIALVVLRNIWLNMKQVYGVIMQSVPDQELSDELQEHIKGLSGVEYIQTFNFWSLDGDEHIVSVAVFAKNESNAQDIRIKIKDMLVNHHINQSTVEVIS